MSSNQKLSNAGIAEKSTGERFIPSSKRPDGTFRKEIKVRPGFTPMEDTATYKSQRAEAWRNRGTGGVPGATDVVGAGPARDNSGATAAAGSRRRRRGRGKRSSTGGGKSGDEQQGSESEGENKPVVAEGDTGNEKAASKEGTSSSSSAPAATTEAAKPSGEKKDDALTEEQAREKQVKAVRKKIRQAAELRDRKNNGEKLLPEQIEKALKLNELVRELEKLGFKV